MAPKLALWSVVALLPLAGCRCGRDLSIPCTTDEDCEAKLGHTYPDLVLACTSSGFCVGDPRPPGEDDAGADAGTDGGIDVGTTPDAGSSCGTGGPCAPGQRCIGLRCVCDSLSCPGGCCVSDTCKVPSAAACGLNGGPCIACNALRADSCNAGSCGCGTGLSCSEPFYCTEKLCSRTWAPAGNMQTARLEHALAVIGNGDVLAVGGTQGLSSSAFNSVEVFHPSTGAWKSTGSLLTGRWGHTLATLPDGRVLVAGGYNFSVPTRYVLSTESYDPGTETWSSAGVLAEPRFRHSMTVLASGSVLVVGGEAGGTTTGDPARTLASAELFDPATNTWSVVGSLATARRSHAAVLLSDGRVLVAGGVKSNSFLSSAELFDPATKTWSPAGSMTTARADATAVLRPSTGQVLLVGGATPSSALATSEAYEPSSNSWTTGPTLLEGRFGHTATVLIDGSILVAGGFREGPIATTELLSVGSGTWLPFRNLLVPRGWHQAVRLPSGATVVVGGKSTAEKTLSSAEQQ